MITEAVALYGVEPSQFVAERNALVRLLKADKRTDEAAVVAKLPRPRMGEYILNRVARDRPDTATAFASAVAAATSAQSNAIGTGDGSALRSTSANLRAASAALLDAGLRQVQADGLDGAGRRDELISTVRSLTNETGAALLVAGIVGSGVSAGEAELFAGAPEPHVAPKRPPAERAPANAAAHRRPAADGAAKPTGRRAVAPPDSKLTAPPKPSATELARSRRHEAQLDKARAVLAKTQREVAAAQRAVDAAAKRLSRAEADEREAAAALDALSSDD